MLTVVCCEFSLVPNCLDRWERLPVTCFPGEAPCGMSCMFTTIDISMWSVFLVYAFCFPLCFQFLRLFLLCSPNVFFHPQSLVPLASPIGQSSCLFQWKHVSRVLAALSMSSSTCVYKLESTPILPLARSLSEIGKGGSLVSSSNPFSSNLWLGGQPLYSRNIG